MEKSRTRRIVGLALLCLVSGWLGVAQGATWYVDKNATGLNNGASWANAWTSFSRVVWAGAGVKAGDTLYISGGATSKTYTESWTIGASGTVSNRITIAVDASNPLHNGTVIFDYDGLGDSGTVDGITFSRDYITIDGNVNGTSRLHIRNLRHTRNRSTASAIRVVTATEPIIQFVTISNCNNGVLISYPQRAIIRNCNIQVRGDVGIGLVSSAGTWDANLVYSNNLELLWNPSTPAGAPYPYSGPDGIQCLHGTSIFGNTIRVSRATVYTSDQHPDSVQAVGSYTKIYNNEFINVGDSGVDFSWWYASNPHDIWIYNNLFRIEQDLDPYPEFIRFYGGGGLAGSFTNIKILQNTFVDGGSWRTVSFYMYGDNPTASNCEIKNNLFYNCGNGTYHPTLVIENSTGFTTNSWLIDGNIFYHPTGAAHVNFRGQMFTAADWVATRQTRGSTSRPNFASYALKSISNDLRLLATDTIACDAGVNLAPGFALDRRGVARPQGGGWDIGAYELPVAGATNQAPVVSAGLDVATTLPINNVILTGVASDPDGTAVAPLWSQVSGPPATIFSGPNLLTTTATFPTNGTYTLRLTVSDGLLSASDDIVVVVHPAPATSGGSITFEAESGTLTAPFTLSNGSVRQDVQTTALAASGRLAFSFSVAQAGNYVVNVTLNAPTEGNNSCWINIDGEPTDPYMIWDIPVTAGFESRAGAWRGSGNFEYSEFVPRIFTLAAGAHTLIIRGRESGVEFDRIEIAPMNILQPSEPRNLRQVPIP